MSELTPGARALAAAHETGASFTVTTHGHVASLEEAAVARGLRPEQVLKSIVIRRGEADFVFVLVPGGRSISWPKLRSYLGVKRLSLPDAKAAFEVTGYVRGTITPLGSSTPWPVIADASVAVGPVSIGGGVSGTAFTFDRDELILALKATVADVTVPEPLAADVPETQSPAEEA